MLAQLVSALILPPGGPLFLIILGLLAARWHRRFARIAVIAGVALLYLFSMPLVAYSLLDRLQDPYAPIQPQDVTGDRLVVLGAGRHPHAAEYGVDAPTGRGLERLRYAAYLVRETNKPLILTGGVVYDGETESEAQLSARVLAQDYNIGVVQLEEHSRNTCENALNTRAILAVDGVETVTVITHAWHMPRAMWCFERAGIPAQAAPTARVSTYGNERGVLSLLPSARALGYSRLAAHEVVGMVWYRVVY